MIKYKNIISELSKPYESAWQEFANDYKINHGDEEYIEALHMIKDAVYHWVGEPTNHDGQRLENVFIDHLPEFGEYQREALRKEFGNTATIARGLQFYVGDIVHYAFERSGINRWEQSAKGEKPPTQLLKRAFEQYKKEKEHKEWYNLITHEHINLSSRGVKYSSWTSDNLIINMYSNGNITTPNYFGVVLTADVPIDKIIFAGEVFPTAYDSVTNKEFVVKHDQPFECVVDVVNVGEDAQQLFDAIGVEYKK